MSQLTLMTILLCIRRVWGKAYSDDPDIVELAAKILPIIAIVTVVTNHMT